MELGHKAEACALFDALKAFAEAELANPATIDYFATSLLLLLVFEEDLEQAKNQQAFSRLAATESGEAGCID